MGPLVTCEPSQRSGYALGRSNPHSLHTTVPITIDKRVPLQRGHRSRTSTHAGSSRWHSVQINT